MAEQLFSLVKSVDVPIFASNCNENVNVYKWKIPATFSVRWPDGKPCTAVELFLNYLIEERTLTIRENDGGTLKVIVSDLSHIIRYCWNKGKGFIELHDEDFHEFVSHLLEEKDPNNPHEYKRNNDTVSRIIDNTIEYLFWIQNHLAKDVVLVGLKSDNSQIALKKKKSYRTKSKAEHVRFYYPYEPTNETKKIKRPIARKIKLALWDAVSDMSDPAGGGRGIIEKSKSEQLGLQKLEFLKKRRELFLELLETTGARPGELIALKVSELDNCTETLRISLPTLKRRKASDPERTIPIEASVAIKIELFIHKQRNELLFNIRENGLTPDPQDRIFLSAINGQPISKGAIDKEFQRIVKKAGITQKACMSLFRHRFITNMIKIHLRAFLNENEGASRLVMTDSDYRTILKKVATFTGHASEMSLFHYIDLAWDELGIFDYVEPATKLVNAVESSITSITSLAGDVRQKRKISNKNLSEFVITELTKIKKTVTDALDGSFRSS